MKFIAKPKVIEAIQLRWDTWSEMCDFAGIGRLTDGKPEGCYLDEDGCALPRGHTSGKMGLFIPTLEGLMLARQNDWIIRGIDGELYPCKPDIFEQSYELWEAK